MSIILQSDSSTHPLTTNSGERVRCYATDQLMSDETGCSSMTDNSNSLANRLLDQLAFANREAVRTTPLNRTNLFPVPFKPDMPVSTESKPRGKMIRSRLAKSLTQALANLS
jgi:hypothetical protein